MKKTQIKQIIKQAYLEVLLEQDLKQEPEQGQQASEGAVLNDATDQILQKFPTVKKILTKLMTSDFKEFVEDIKWVSPKPTTFSVVLANGQDFTLTWMGKNFQATVLGKEYYLGKVSQFQQALDKLTVLYQQAAMPGEQEEEPESMDSEFGDNSSGGGGEPDFPGEEPAGDDFEEPAEGGEEEGEDLGDEEIDFEEPGEEPE